MLVISNGAFKCGSTWLFNILTSLQNFAWPETAFLTKRNTKHPAIAESKLAAYLAGDVYESRDVISKNHLDQPEHRALLLSHQAVRVFCMTRDSRDVIVSAYYHDRRRLNATSWDAAIHVRPDQVKRALVVEKPRGGEAGAEPRGSF